MQREEDSQREGDSQIGKATMAEAFAAHALWFVAIFLRRFAMHPEQFLPILSA